jgi:hypothetical protein
MERENSSPIPNSFLFGFGGSFAPFSYLCGMEAFFGDGLLFCLQELSA